jgi:hypothetical protein
MDARRGRWLTENRPNILQMPFRHCNLTTAKTQTDTEKTPELVRSREALVKSAAPSARSCPPSLAYSYTVTSTPTRHSAAAAASPPIPAPVTAMESLAVMVVLLRVCGPVPRPALGYAAWLYSDSADQRRRARQPAGRAVLLLRRHPKKTESFPLASGGYTISPYVITVKRTRRDGQPKEL